MGDIKLITVERNSKLKREDVRRAIEEAYKKREQDKSKDGEKKKA